MANTKSTRTRSENTQLAVMANDIKYVVKSVDDLNNKIDHNYVTKDQFEPVKRIVYGLVGLILVAVVGALLSLVIGKS